MKKILLTLCCLLAPAAMPAQTAPAQLDLSGVWRFQLDPMGFGKTAGSELYQDKLAETIVLPGTTDEAGKGIVNHARHVDRLSRRFEYMGQAWYQREVVIPQAWAGRQITLHLERCHWETAVYVDGRHVGTDERLSTPNRFNLTAAMTPGIHTLTICVDNRLKYPMDQWAHGTTEYTQTNWNGIVGRIALEARPHHSIGRVQVYPDVEGRRIAVHLRPTPPPAGQPATLRLTVNGPDGRRVALHTQTVDSVGAAAGVEVSVPMGKDVRLWDEFAPNLYTLQAAWSVGEDTDTTGVTFGMRSVSQGDNHVRLNGHDIHLRGTLECCVFPLTGYPATDVASWERILRTIKSYGMNHVRFHSWCPPEAAFTAADRLGMYLQTELPMWIKDVGRYPARRTFFEKEMYALLDEYGNHPSFILMCNGNENEGDFSVLEDLVVKARKHDPRRLYSASTARKHVAADQFYVSHVTHKGGITVYEGWPNTDWDKTATSDIDVPTIAHESGQRCMYPNFDEMAKYTGVLEPRNFEVFRERLARHGMLHQAGDFFRATGAHTVLHYKEVNESLLRTSNSGGFQLLGLSDFPGQGSAFVGVLDAFWESKGLVTPAEFRRSCAPTVLLARMPRRCYSPADTLSVKMGIYHYAPHTLRKARTAWRLTADDGRTIARGNLDGRTVAPYTTDSLGLIRVPLSAVTEPTRLTLSARIDTVNNAWDFWVYPETPAPAATDVAIVTAWDDQARSLLAQGKRVLLIPDACPGRKTHFASHFWNPIMFNWQPLIVGTLIDKAHPALAQFPTDMWADWQWDDILRFATAMEMDGLPGVTPIIQSVDTYEHNHKLGIAFEAQVGPGRLFVLGLDVNKQIARRPATRQLLRSIRAYVGSDRFRPATSVPQWQIDALFAPQAQAAEGEAPSAAVQQLLNK